MDEYSENERKQEIKNSISQRTAFLYDLGQKVKEEYQEVYTMQNNDTEKLKFLDSLIRKYYNTLDDQTRKR